MAFREVSVVQVKEALRRWLRGDGERLIAQGVGVDRKTARRYIAAAVECGVDRCGGEEQLTDELIGQVVERVRPHRVDGHGEAWRAGVRRRCGWTIRRRVSSCRSTSVGWVWWGTASVGGCVGR